MSYAHRARIPRPPVTDWEEGVTPCSFEWLAAQDLVAWGLYSNVQQSRVPAALRAEWHELGKTPQGYQALQRQLIRRETEYHQLFNARHPTTTGALSAGNTPSDEDILTAEETVNALKQCLAAIEAADRVFLQQRNEAAKAQRQRRDKKRKALAKQRRHAR